MTHFHKYRSIQNLHTPPRASHIWVFWQSNPHPPFKKLTNMIFFPCVLISAVSATILIRVPKWWNFAQIHTHPSHTVLNFPPRFWATLSNSCSLRHISVSNDPGLPGEGVGVSIWSIDTLLTRNFTPVLGPEKVKMEVGRVGASVSWDIRKEFALIVLVLFEQLGWGGALTSVWTIFIFK